MAIFSESAKSSLKTMEGGWNQVAGDKGGETACGVARNSNADWKGWALVDKIKAGTVPGNYRRAVNARIEELWPLAFSLYSEKYWKPLKIDGLNDQLLADHVFDISVNSGPGPAIKMLQEAAGAVVDGDCGPGTLKAANGKPSTRENLVTVRRAFFYAIAQKNPSQLKFLNGWLARANSFSGIKAVA